LKYFFISKGVQKLPVGLLKILNNNTRANLSNPGDKKIILIIPETVYWHDYPPCGIPETEIRYDFYPDTGILKNLSVENKNIFNP
jgi:hypothetical protein